MARGCRRRQAQKDMHGSSHRQGGAGDWSEDIETKRKVPLQSRARACAVCVVDCCSVTFYYGKLAYVLACSARVSDSYQPADLSMIRRTRLKRPHTGAPTLGKEYRV